MADQYWWQRLLNVLAWFSKIVLHLAIAGGIIGAIYLVFIGDFLMALGALLIPPFYGLLFFLSVRLTQKIANYIIIGKN